MPSSIGFLSRIALLFCTFYSTPKLLTHEVCRGLMLSIWPEDMLWEPVPLRGEMLSLDYC